MSERKVITADDFKDADSIKNMITNKCGSNVNGNDEEGYTPLCAAILLGISQEVLINFINTYTDDINLNKKCNKGKTPLQMVCMSMNTAALDVLMGAGVEVPAFITNPYSDEQIPKYKLDPTTHEYTTEQDTVEISIDDNDSDNTIPGKQKKSDTLNVEARDVMSSSILPKPEIFQKLINNFKDLYLNYKSLIDKDLNNPLHLACIVSCYGIIDSLESAIVKTILDSLDIVFDTMSSALKALCIKISSLFDDKIPDNKIKEAVKESIKAVISDISTPNNNYTASIKANLEDKLNITFSEDDAILTTIDSIKNDILEYNIPIINKTPVELIDLIMTFFVNAPNRDLKTPFMIAFENEDDGLIDKLAKYVKLSIQLSSIIAYYATSDKEDDKKEQIKNCLLRLITSIIENQLSNLENYSLESFNNLFDCLNTKFTLPGGSESSLLKYIENIAKTKFEELFNSLKEKLKDIIKSRLDNNSDSFNPTLASDIIKSYYKNTSNENAGILLINIDELTNEQIRQLDDKDIQPIIGTLKYVPKGITILYYNNSNNQRTTIPPQCYSINECEVTWNKTAADYKALNGQRCYFSNT